MKLKNVSGNKNSVSITHPFKVLIAVLLCFGLTGMDCNKKEPPCLTCPDNKPTNCEYPAGNRSFTWRLDTVAWWPSKVAGVWAFSDNDAYVMGSISGPTVPGQKQTIALHWNGNVWNDSINGTWGYDNVTEQWGDISIGPLGDVIGDDHFLVGVGYWGYSTTIYAGVAEFDNHAKKWKSYQLQAVGELRCVWTDGNGYFIAAGDNGMVYTKDGYASNWVYQKVPTSFNITKICGASKKEIYFGAYIAYVSGKHYNQYWKYDGMNWFKLYDEEDTVGTIIKLEGTEHAMNDIAAYRCSITDSLKLYLIGWESFLLESKGQDLDFKITNLSSLGLPLRSMSRSAFRISLLSPNDYWVFGTRFNTYHWNGYNFQKIIIPGLPNDNMTFGYQGRIIRTRTGKIFFYSEVSSQVYVIVQGKP